MSTEAILAILTLIEQFLPLLGTSAATANSIDTIVKALVKLLPYIIGQVSTVYTAVKNIIALLQNHGAILPDQIVTLQQLDAQVDSAWAELLPQIDPDNPANAGTPAGG